MSIRSFSELNLEYLPVPYRESSLYVTCEGLTWLRVTGVLEVVVADRELGVRFLHIWAVYNADVTTSKDRAFIWIASDCKLGKV